MKEISPHRLYPRNAKLDAEIVRMIRTSKQTSRALASLVGVSKETINLCRKRKTWSHVR